MQWASLDSFLVQDAFWQDKMGKPIANRDFLLALIEHGRYERYRFYYLDDDDRARARDQLANLLGHDDFARIDFATQSGFADDARAGAVEVLHQGDFTYFAPHLMEYRARAGPRAAYAVSGVTHSLDRVHLHARLLQILLAGPREFDTIVCSSDCAATMLKNAFDSLREAFAQRFKAELAAPPELVRIPLGLSGDHDEAPARGRCRRALGLDDERLVLLALGRFSVRRKMDLSPFLECLEHLIAQGALPPLTLILAGGGTDSDIALVRDIVARLGLEPHVRIEANITSARKRELYGGADVFVSLADNHQETFGLTVIEAMAHGLALVVSDFDGYRELVRDGETGFRIPTYASPSDAPWDDIAGLLDPSMLSFRRSQKVAVDLERLARALVELAHNPERRRAMGEAARADGARYRWASIIPRYEAMWDEQRRRALEARDRPANEANRFAPLLGPDFARLFGHYASRTLDAETPVRISAYCNARAAQGFAPTIYTALDGRLEFAVMQEIMGRMGAAFAPLGPVLEGAAQATGRVHERVVLNFDFLLKHGYIEIGAVDRAPAAPGLNTPGR